MTSPSHDPAEDEVLAGVREGDLVPLEVLQGLDSAVVDGFLGLAPATRQALITEYASCHGEAAGAWLSRAALLWPQKRLGVSRVTLARLFALLPQYMSQSERLELAKSIWHVARAPSSAVLRVPANFRNHRVLSEMVREHFMSVLPSALELPAPLQLSIPWLHDPAMQAQHDVLNLLLLAERDQLLLIADEQIAVLFARPVEGLEIRSSITIAGHELVLRTDAAVQVPVLWLRTDELPRAKTALDLRGSQSALKGAVIGTAIALLLAALVLWLN